VRDPVREVVDRVVPAREHQGALESRWLRAYLLMLGPWLVPEAREGAKDQVQVFVDWKPKARASPRDLSESDGHARDQLDSLALGYARAYLMGIALEPSGDPERVGRGVSRSGTLDPEA
jgi:hypothetical protein